VLLPRGFYVEEMQRDRHSVFRALALLWKKDQGEHAALEVRGLIVSHLCMNWSQPWWSRGCRLAFCKYMKRSHIHEESVDYRSMMMHPVYARGDFPELVAAGQVIGLHIMVMVHYNVNDDVLYIIQINQKGLEVRADNTLHLLRVADGHFHALQMTPTDEDESNSLQPGCLSVSNSIYQTTADLHREWVELGSQYVAEKTARKTFVSSHHMLTRAKKKSRSS